MSHPWGTPLVGQATLKLHAATTTAVACADARAQVLNAVRVLTRVVPALLEDAAWDGFWATPAPVGVTSTMVPYMRWSLC